MDGTIIEAEGAESKIMKCAKIILDYLTLKGIAKLAEIVKVAQGQGYSKWIVDRALNYLLAIDAIEKAVRVGSEYSLTCTAMRRLVCRGWRGRLTSLTQLYRFALRSSLGS
jgi:hypothetical protein